MSQFANLGVLCRRAGVGMGGMGMRTAVGGRRGMASAKPLQDDDGALPLKGIRVLDMTRVLAGVRILSRALQQAVWSCASDQC